MIGQISRPHPKSYTMEELATHLAWVPYWMKPTLELDLLDMTAPDAMGSPKAMKTNAELLAFFDAGITTARSSLEAASPECMAGMWSLAFHGQTHFTMPRHVVVQSFIFNHAIHHRGAGGLPAHQRPVPAHAVRAFGGCRENAVGPNRVP